MQKIQAVVHQPDVDVFLNTMQKFGAVEFVEVTNDSLKNLSATAPHADLLPRVQHVTKFLSLYETKKSLWRSLREGNTTNFTEESIVKKIEDTDALLSVVVDAEALQVELSEKTAEVQYLESQHALLKTWSAFENKLADLETETTVSILVSKPADGKIAVEELVTAALEKVEVVYGKEVFGDRLLLTILRGDLSTIETVLTASGLTMVARPEGREDVSVELAAVEEKLAAVKGELGILHDQAEHVAQIHFKDLQISEEILTWEQERFSTLDRGASTETTAVFNGWVVADQMKAIKTELEKKEVAAAFSDLELAEGEVPPVEIENNGFIKPFEFVTRLYGMPGHKDLDPTMFLAGFFFLFFGLALTDVGYGVFLMAVATAALTLFKLAPGVRMFMKLLLFMGLASALVGLLFGGYLGIAPELLPDWAHAIQLFDPIGDPLPVFYLALGLGVLQVMVGMLLKIYSEFRNGKLMDGIMDQGPWLFLFVLGILYVGAVTGYISFVTTDVIVKLVYLGFALVVLSSGRKGETLVGKIIAALAALYNDGIGYFSDILSYSRLLALGLATSALAFAVNLIAELVSGTPYVGPILAVAVVVIGHLFALAINTLGAFIHSARLQFIEFFGKFISDSGRSFKPLSRSARHITAREE